MGAIQTDAIEAALDAGPRLVAQPIVDLARGVPVGYEVLARFEGLPPVEAFAEADRRGVGAELEAAVIVAAQALRAELPANCFLSVNVGPKQLVSAPVRQALAAAGSLHGIVLELTEHAEVADYDDLMVELIGLRARGAAIAIDDAGAGYASMRHITMLRPDFVKVDAAFVADVDREPAKFALVEMLGAFAGRLDAWLVAEGVETDDELMALQRLGVPLAQGFHLARPGDPWPELVGGVAATIAARAERTRSDTVAALLELAPSAHGEAEARTVLERRPRFELVLVLDDWDRPLQLVARDGALRATMRVAPTAAVADVARRAMSRPAECRFDPVVCCDETGRYVGVVRVETLVERLAG